jgi:hypothetical protein
MLKRFNNSIYYKEEEYQCTWHTVVDQAATNAKIAECEDKWQAEIDECDAQIAQYKALIGEINSKMKEADGLQQEFLNNTAAMDKANITHPGAVGAMGGCQDCLSEVKAAYSGMISQCESSIATWNQKKTTAQNKRGSCPADTPKVYKEVCD